MTTDKDAISHDPKVPRCCGREMALFVPHGSLNAIHNRICTAWRSPAEWMARRCEICGQVKLYYQPPEVKDGQ